MKMNRKSFKFEFKAGGETEPGTFEGYGSVFNVVDSYDQIVAPGAFTESLAAIKAAGRSVPVLWQHNMDAPIGMYTTLEQDGIGLKVVGKLAVPDVQQANEAYALLKMGAVHDLSIGYYTKNSTMDDESGVLTLNAVDLVEVSIVTLGACPPAQIQNVKARIEAGDFLSMREFEEFLREKGYSRSQAEAIATCGYKSFLARESKGDSESTEKGTDDLINLLINIRKNFT